MSSIFVVRLSSFNCLYLTEIKYCHHQITDTYSKKSIHTLRFLFHLPVLINVVTHIFPPPP